ncbi:MAG: hypothetical protein RHS_5830 [Robinsoniella sp. RHS]|nr:MAG: hypothetical protein RHS_5830 [Robinsoniella sp. RHS]
MEQVLPGMDSTTLTLVMHGYILTEPMSRPYHAWENLE